MVTRTRSRLFSTSAASPSPVAADGSLLSSAVNASVAVRGDVGAVDLHQNGRANGDSSNTGLEVFQAAKAPALRIPKEFRISRVPSDGRLPLEIIAELPPGKITEEMMDETVLKSQKGSSS